MKKIIIALALVGLTYSGSEAQTKGSDSKAPCKCAAIAAKAKATNVAHTHRHSGATGDTYQVCVEKGGHYQCCMHHKTTTKVVAK